MSDFAEQQTEWVISNSLVNNGWVIDEKAEKNVYFQKARPEHQSKLEIISKKRGYKKPDYILYHQTKPIGIIEAKAGGKPLKEALKQATEYAEMLGAPLIFASNGAYVETNHLFKNLTKQLFINGEEVNRLITYKEAIKFIEEGENEIYTIPKEIVTSKENLVKIFKRVNALLRKANIFSGYDRISEFSNILFLKLVSEKDGEKSWWNLIKKQDDDLLFKTLNSTIIKELENTYGGDVFSTTNIEKPALFRQIMDMIDPLALSVIKTDVKGDAFEYFLRNMNQADNDLGQYFTPRHIVQSMIHLVNPKFRETVYDPFCGTGGFLIESFNHIKGNTIIETDTDKKVLTEETLFGRDATKVSTIAKKNMILHGDGHSNIEKLDSLENLVDGKFKCIITNIPFSLKDVDYSHLYYNSLGRKNGDAICVLHCLKALQEGGRMAVIVPEGFLFKKELKEVRKFLLSKANLELVVSLPQGAFLPYTGVKTDILYFTNAHRPISQDGYYYFEIKNDGYTLDAHRRKISGKNDIHTLEGSNLKKPEKELLLASGFEFVSFEKIKANDYNLVGARYREVVKNLGKWEVVRLKEVVLDIKDGGTPPRKTSTSSDYFGGDLNWCVVKDIQPEIYNTQERLTELGLKNCSAKLWPVDSIIISLGATIGNVGIVKKPTATKQGLSGIIVDETRILPKYLYYILLSKKEAINNMATGATIKEVRPSKLSAEFVFPLPPLAEQQKLVDALDKIQASIQPARDLIKNLKSQEDLASLLFENEGLQVVKLRDICRYEGGTQPPKSTFEDIPSDSNIRLLQIRDYKSEEWATYISQAARHKTCTETDIMIGRYGPPVFQILRGKAGAYNVALIKTIPDETRLLKDYLYMFLQSEEIQKHIISLSIRARQSGVSPKDLNELLIPLPSIEIQKQFVDEMNAKNEYIKLTEQLIEKQQTKMNNLIDCIWC